MTSKADNKRLARKKMCARMKRSDWTKVPNRIVKTLYGAGPTSKHVPPMKNEDFSHD